MAANTFTEVNGTTAVGKSTLLSYLATMTPGGTAGISLAGLDFIGGTTSASTFDSLVLGGGIPDFGLGILITSGDGTPPRTNTSSSYTVNLSLPGTTELTTFAHNAFASAGASQDANVITLHVNVTDPNVQSIKFDVAFGSDEYPEYSNTSFVDIAAVATNGLNFGLVNGAPDQPLSVISKNLTLGAFVNNQDGHLAIEYDGFIKVLSVHVPVHLGMNDINLEVADTGDHAYDSGLFIVGLASSTTNAGGTFQQINGTTGNDVELGSPNNEEFYGGGGDDNINGYGGTDLCFGGDGNDIGILGLGGDSFYGGNGNDYAYLYGGNNTAYGGAGLDVLIADTGNDTLAGDTGFNYLFGGGGNDTLFGNGGGGGTDVNVMYGGTGNDTLIGGLGTNYFYGGLGTDTMYGGPGLNIFISSGEPDGDIIVGGTGQNYVYGSNGGDNVKGGANTDVFILGSGNDTVDGNGGVDYSFGGGGSDTYVMNGALAGTTMVVNGFGSDDHVLLQSTSLTSFADVLAFASFAAGIGTTIIVDPGTNDQMWLIGVVPGDLTSSNFLFA